MAPPKARVAMTFSVMNTIATRSRMSHLLGAYDVVVQRSRKDLTGGEFLHVHFASFVKPSALPQAGVGARAGRLNPGRSPPGRLAAPLAALSLAIPPAS